MCRAQRFGLEPSAQVESELPGAGFDVEVAAHLRARDLPRRYWRVVAVLVAFGIVNFPDALLLLRLNEIGFSVVEVILD